MPAVARQRLITLGRLTLLDAAGTEQRELATRKRKLALLAFLALTRRAWSRDSLVELFWGEQDEARARHSLSDALSHLRRVLGPDAITQRRTDVALADHLALEVDALALHDAARAQAWSTVVSLYDGPFLDGVHVSGSPRLEQWMDGERRRLESLFTTGARAECERLLQERDGAAATACADLALRWLVASPLSPHAAVFRLRALSANGTPEAELLALDEFEAIAQRLQRDFGATPDQVVVAVANELADRVRSRRATHVPVLPQVGAVAESVTPAPAPADTPSKPNTPTPDRPPVVHTHTSSWRRPTIFATAALVLVAIMAVRPWARAATNRTQANTQANDWATNPVAVREAARPAVLTTSAAARTLYDRASAAYERDGNREEAVRLLDSAIALDSGFAMAYRRMGNIYDNGVDGRSRSVLMLTLAARHAARLPENERLLTLGAYHRTVTGNFARAASAYRALLERAPGDARAWGSLGTVYDYLGDRQRAVDAYERSIALDARHALTWMNLADGRYSIGDVRGAWRALDSMALVFPGHPGLFMRTASLAHAEGNREHAEAQLQALINASTDNPYLHAAGEMLLAKAYWSWGQLDAGDAARRRAVVIDRARGAREAALTGELELAMAAVWLRDDSTRARREATAALRRTPLTSLPVDDRPYLDAVIALASAGQVAAARAVLHEYEQTVDSLERRRNRSREYHARGMIAYAGHSYAEARRHFAQVSEPLCRICGLPELALAWAHDGQADSARAVYRRYRETYSQRRLDMTSPFHDARLAQRLATMLPSLTDLRTEQPPDQRR